MSRSGRWGLRDGLWGMGDWGWGDRLYGFCIGLFHGPPCSPVKIASEGFSLWSVGLWFVVGQCSTMAAAQPTDRGCSRGREGGGGGEGGRLNENPFPTFRGRLFFSYRSPPLSHSPALFSLAVILPSLYFPSLFFSFISFLHLSIPPSLYLPFSQSLRLSFSPFLLSPFSLPLFLPFSPSHPLFPSPLQHHPRRLEC